MEAFVARIRKDLVRFNPILEFIPVEDIDQEIRFALLTAKQGHVYRVAARLCYNLASEYGFSRRKGKDQFQPYYKEVEFSDEEKKVLLKIEQYYQVEDHTATQTCEEFGITKSHKVVKLLAQCFPKNKSNHIKRG